MIYRQVELARGPKRDTAWIPIHFAQPGRHLRIHGEDGWRVVSAGIILNDEELDYRINEYRDHRRSLDI
jgi:hypothetical protein